MEKSYKEITYVLPDSIADEAGIEAGDILLSVNGTEVHDILEYRYLLSDFEVTVTIQKKNGDIEEIVMENDYEDIGLEFSTGLMDNAKSCTNKCIFCFIDQLPKGMRETVYFKDDDSRLSFLQGNYVTLTNMREEDIKRLIDLRISPINISVHTTNPELREKMLSNRFAGNIFNIMKQFAESEIYMNCQVVLCPRINDGDELKRTVFDIASLYPYVNSLAIVPVGLTKHRQGLYPLEEFDSEGAKAVIDAVSLWQNKFLKEMGTRLIYLSDEFYLKAGLLLPAPEEYEGYPQMENGVGLIASLEEEFLAALDMLNVKIPKRHISLATGELAYPFIKGLCEKLSNKTQITIDVYAVKNNFFGGGVNVAGLVTGQDIIKTLKGKISTEELFIPEVMLRQDTELFLDDITVSDIERELNTKITAISNDGYEFIEKLTGSELEF